MFPEGDSVDTCLNEAGQSNSHSIFESKGENHPISPFARWRSTYGTGALHARLPSMQSTYLVPRIPGQTGSRGTIMTAVAGNYARQYSRH